MISSSNKTYISVAIIIFGFIAVFSLSNFLKLNRPEMPESYIDEDLSLQGEKLQGWSLGFEGLIADWYWVQSLQYIGTKVSTSKEQTINLENLTTLNPRLLYPLLDNATTLDPHFMAAYSYGAVVLPAIDNEQAIKIAEKGIKNNPENWRLYQHLGYIHWRAKDFQKAAETYKKGSEIKGSPLFLKAMEASMLNAGGSRETSRKVYQQMFDEAKDSQTRDLAQVRLLQLDSEDEMESINIAIAKFVKQNNRCMRSWKEVLPLLKDIKLPNGKDLRVDKDGNLVDPTDTPYVITNKDNICGIELNKNSTIPRI